MIVHFEALGHEDVGRVLEVECASSASPWTRELFLHELGLPFSKITAAWLHRDREVRLAGYICRWLVADEIHILNLAVDPVFRRAGIGRALVDLVLGEGKEAGISQVILEVRKENTAARGLYRKLGFLEQGQRRNYYGRGEDALVMSCSLMC